MAQAKPFMMSMVHKLILSFVLSGFCLIAALVYSIYGLSDMHEMEREIAGKDLKAATIVLRLRELIAAQERLVGRFIIQSLPEYRSTNDLNAEEFRQKLRNIKEVHINPDIAGLEEGYRRYSELTDRVFKGQQPDVDGIKSAVEDVLKKIDLISEDQRLDLAKKLVVSDLHEEKTVAWTMALAFTGVVFAFLIAGFMVYSFSSSIGKLQHATHRIAEGDFEHDPRIPTGDEIGALSEDFRKMAVRLKELEQISLDASPLTRLPGNIAIERAIDRRLRDQTSFAMCYLDLDNFKSYNDKYGYIKASEVIKDAGKMIYEAVKDLGDPDSFVGHIGGDDFVVIITADKAEIACKAIIRELDALIPGHYSETDRREGAIEGIDRYGVPRKFPLISISIAALICRPGDYAHATEIATAAAKVKDQVKMSIGSNYVIEMERE